MSKKDYTVILINDNQAACADLTRKGLVTGNGIASQSLSSESNLVDSIESLLKDNRVGKKTLVLTTRIWSQIVMLPRLAVDGLSDEELKNAMQFEVETLSGVDAELAVVGYSALRQTSEHIHYWVSVCTKFEFDQTVTFLESRGSRSVLLAHPAGMSHRSQIEFWPSLTCLCDKDDISKTRFCHANIDTNRWMEDFELGMDSVQNRQYLVAKSEHAESILNVGVSKEKIINLQVETDLIHWFESVAESYGNREEFPPLLQKAKPTSLPKTRILLKVALALVAVLACYLHWSWMQKQEIKLADEIESLQKPVAEKKLYDGEIFKTIKTRNDLEQEAEKIRLDSKKVQFLLESQTDRVAHLLQILRKLHTNDIMINEIAQDETGLYIAGISLNSETAPLLANRMRDLARPKGWQVTPATQKGKKEMVNGGPWEFKIRLTDNGPIQSGVTAQSLDTLPVNKKRP